jgi:ATP-dependent DNA helicase RecG
MTETMTFSNLKKLIAADESGKLEFKKSTATLKSGAETLCGFLNGSGGTVLIGVANNMKIIGQHVTDQTQQEVAQVLRRFEPTANIEVSYINVPDTDKLIIKLTAHPDKQSVPYTFDGRAYERKETATILMPQTRYQQLLMFRNLTPTSWESQPAIGVSIDDLDQNEIINTLKDITRKKRLESSLIDDNPINILTRLRLIENELVTNAAVVLFAKEMSGNYLQCVVRMARFKGLEKRNFIDSRHVFGNAFQLLNDAEVFINRNSAIASHMEKGKMARVDTPEYPYVAVREALINAICHHDYSSLGGSITITIFDDRLEIASTGVLLSGVSINQLQVAHSSHSRNPRITNVFFRRGLIEAMGIGTQEIIKSCVTANMKKPDFYEQAGSFVVRMWSPYYQPAVDKEALSARQQSILMILEKTPLPPHEILTVLQRNISERTLRRELQFLKEKGLVDSEGHGWQNKWFIK